jgi:hypothetical protein
MEEYPGVTACQQNPESDPRRLEVFGPTRRSAPLRTVGKQGAEK